MTRVCHERRVRFLFKRLTIAGTATRTRAYIRLRDDRHARLIEILSQEYV